MNNEAGAELSEYAIAVAILVVIGLLVWKLLNG
jgi:hypothetical protein